MKKIRDKMVFTCRMEQTVINAVQQSLYLRKVKRVEEKPVKMFVAIAAPTIGG